MQSCNSRVAPLRKFGVGRTRKPEFVLVYGDGSSTVAATLECSKLRIRVGHVEAGLRSFDRTMPEEINRIVTDQLADLLVTHAEDGDINRVGNVMIDSLIQLLPALMRFSKNGVPQRYALVTLHRPSNVDDGADLKNILQPEAESFASGWCAPGSMVMATEP
jgi:UDP-N-acetylglucosamine 2-epimerase (non-hydrolysing)